MSAQEDLRLVSIKEACGLTNMSRATLWNRRRNDPTFPRLVEIGSRKSFVSTELQAWIRRQIAVRDGAGI
jgi:predicted DNA-binding transcriptional regulator AlpA